jgi:hypothetical protein
MSYLNLDQQAALCAQQMVKEGSPVKDAKALENVITKTLGVLQEQGVYACMLFLFSRTSHEEKITPKIRLALYRVLQKLPGYQTNVVLTGFNEESKAVDVLPFYANNVCHDLDTLLLVKDLYEQTLIYARYGAKAEKERGT